LKSKGTEISNPSREKEHLNLYITKQITEYEKPQSSAAVDHQKSDLTYY
jgi:hypothetical protein